MFGSSVSRCSPRSATTTSTRPVSKRRCMKTFSTVPPSRTASAYTTRSEEHTSELPSRVPYTPLFRSAELHHAEIGGAGRAFVAPPVVQHQEAHVRIVGLALLAALGHDDLDAAGLEAALHEDVLHRAALPHRLRVHDQIGRAHV